MLTGPNGKFVMRDGLLDTGADDTVFDERTAALLGVDLNKARERSLYLVGRGILRGRYAQVHLSITDGIKETYDWTTQVVFVPFGMSRSLLGYSGFLQYFDAHFRSYDQEFTLTANKSFPIRGP